MFVSVNLDKNNDKSSPHNFMLDFSHFSGLAAIICVSRYLAVFNRKK